MQGNVKETWNDSWVHGVGFWMDMVLGIMNSGRAFRMSNRLEVRERRWWVLLVLRVFPNIPSNRIHECKREVQAREIDMGSSVCAVHLLGRGNNRCRQQGNEYIALKYTCFIIMRTGKKILSKRAERKQESIRRQNQERWIPSRKLPQGLKTMQKSIGCLWKLSLNTAIRLQASGDCRSYFSTPDCRGWTYCLAQMQTFVELKCPGLLPS